MSSSPGDPRLPAPRHSFMGNLWSYIQDRTVGSHHPTPEQYGGVPPITRYGDCPCSVCLHVGLDGNECLKIINCDTVAEHFRAVHGIKKLFRDKTTVCRWRGCGQSVSRRDFVRHVRERHLQHPRGLAHATTSRMESVEMGQEVPSGYPDTSKRRSSETGGNSGKQRQNADPHRDTIYAERGISERKGKSGKQRQNADPRWDTIHAERGKLERKDESGMKLRHADPYKDTIHAERGELGRRASLLDEAVEEQMRQGSPLFTTLWTPQTSSLRGQAERKYRVDEAERTRDARNDFPNIDRKAADGTGGDSRNERENADRHNDAVHPERSESECLVLPSDAADKGRVDPDTERNTFQIERSNLGSRAHTVLRQGEVGEERKDVDPQNGSVHTERNEQEPDTFSLQGQAEREGVEVQNDSPHTEGDELELMVYPPGEAGVGQENSVTESYSPRTEAASRVFGQGEAREERDDAEPLGSSLQRERNGLELEVSQTGAIVMAREDTGPQSLPSEPEPNICVTRGTTEPPSVASQVSMLNHSVRMLEDNPSLVPPGANLEPHRTSLISKLAKLFRRQKSPQGTQEKRGASPKIVHAGQFNEPVVVTSWNADRQAPQPSEANQHQPVTPMDDGSRPSTRNRDDQSSMDPSKYRPTTAPTDTIDGQTNDDGEHDGDCCCFCFKLSPSKMTLKW